MREVSALIAAVILVTLGAVHVFWAMGGQAGKAAAIPTRDGRPVIRPSRFGTATVGASLVVAAVLVLSTSGVLWRLAPPTVARSSSCLLALVFLARAVGDFRYVGMFKRITDSRFARRDTRIYSPLCGLLAILIAFAAM